MDDLLTRLRAVAEARASKDPAHDFAHVLRVTGNARRIAEAEGARLDVVLPATMLHELFNYPKGHPDSPCSGEVCAEHALVVLRDEGVARELAEAIATCIREHPFSRGVVPATLEGRVVQDADRLDAIGAIGVARCMATCAEMKRPFYAPVDPFCRAREPDDKAWGLDHFYAKLLRIPDALHTRAARAMAAERQAFMVAFLGQLEREIVTATRT
jgi:uncharacterized protein